MILDVQSPKNKKSCRGQYYELKIPSLLEKYLLSSKFKSILDCGCGDGNTLFALKKKGHLNGKNVSAVDLSKKKIDLVKKIDRKIVACVDNVEKLETVGDGSIDFLIANQVIEHVDDRRMLESIKRVLKKKGIVYLSTVFKKWYGFYFYRNKKGNRVLDPSHIKEYKGEKRLRKIIKNNKLEVVENRKRQIQYPLIDFFTRKRKIKDRGLYIKNRSLRYLRDIKIPIPGYYYWDLILKK